VEIGKTLYAKNKIEWRAWLRKNYNNEKEIWLIYYKKETGKPRVEYNDAVEEALCYGWIDSTVKSIDSKRFAQRFSPRKKTSNLSQSNIERITKLIAQKKMTRAGLKAIEHLYHPAKKKTKKAEVPEYLLKELKKYPDAERHFKKFPDAYKRIRIAYIESRKKRGEKEFKTALNYFVRNTAKNKRIGILKI
jgi:uncharacterized protein YdeI (YjbR/CyaY-like superfamily)